MEGRRFAGFVLRVLLLSSTASGLLLGGAQAAWGGQPNLRPRTGGEPAQRKEFLRFRGRGTDQPLPPGATHAYLFDLGPGDFLDIQLEQKNLDVAANVLGPGNRFLFRVDSLNGAFGPERVPLLAESAGRYAVEVVDGGSGTYQIRVPPRHKATARDRQNYLGAMAYSLGKELAAGGGKDRLLAEKEFQKAIRAWTKSGYLAGQADASFRLSRLHRDRKAWRESIVALKPAMDRYHRLGNHFQEVHALNDLGLAYKKLGELKTAAHSYDRAFALAHRRKYIGLEADVLFNHGIMDSEAGEYDRALAELDRAVAAYRIQTKPLAMAKALNALGRLHSNLDETDTALLLHGQVLQILRQNPDDETMASTLTHLGDAYRRKEDYHRAISFYLQALTLTQRSHLPDDPSTLNNLAVAYFKLQRYTEALSALQHCERTFASQGDVESTAVAWSNIGWVLTFLGRYKAAFDAYKQSLEMVRDPPAEAAVYFGMAWAERKQNNLITARNFIGKALAIIESLRTKASRAKLRTSFLAGRQSFYDLLVEILMEQHRHEPAKGYDLQAFEVSEKARSRSLLDALEGQPVLPAPSVQDLQQQILGKDTVLLEYFLGEERSFLWIVTPSSLSSRELPPGSRITALAQEVHSLMSISNRLENRGEALRKATELSHILFGALAKDLSGKRVLIVAPPALQYISFAALPADVTNTSNAGSAWPTPWAKDHEIVVEPSATVLATLRRKHSGRRLPSGLIAVLADPVYSLADERARGIRSRAPAQQNPSLLSRLQFSRWELDAIKQEVKGAKRLFASSFEANRQMVLAGYLSDFRYLHFSTHGVLDKDHPDGSAIVLSLLDRKGSAVNGFLRAGEIASLKLPADLVVLSACKTGLGREIRGEGLVGLTQAFFFAGASRVMVSLWDVDAQATADLMRRFYGNLFRKNLAPAAALREAQEWMWSQQKWNAPAYWAGFVLQGEWR